MSTDKIYIQLLDGSTAWASVDATKVADNQYKILDDKEFTDYVDPLYLHEFYPGDTVELEPHTFMDGTKGQVAKKLVNMGQWSDRRFNEFKFKATLGQLTINQQTADKYQDEIARVKKEHSLDSFSILQ